jgi:non-specific protein-tyrosine kinase
MSRLKKALEKAKEARRDLPEKYEQPASAPLITPYVSQGTIEQPYTPPIKPTYTQTRQCAIDQLLIRRNRIISVCSEDEADRLKILRLQILNTLGDSEKNTLLVTSANHQEGKTLTAINLAISFSHQTNKTVLLVDADIRKPSIHDVLGLGVHPGLSDYLSGRAGISDLLVNPGMDRIVILPAGKPMRNSAELLASPRMTQLFEVIKQKYPELFIIFDGAPVLKSADPLVFSNFIESIMIVVEAEKTSKQDLKRVFEMLKGKPIIGTVLNKVQN